MDKDFFQFKTFKLRNRDSALKINSDGVLLAAWAKLSSYDSVLDVGTAGGVIAFILKYRFENIKVHGIDIDEPSISEAKYNLSINSWSNISFQQTSLQEYERSYARNSYDHIVSNPPFYPEQATETSRISFAKHTSVLQFSELIQLSANLLSFVGKLSLIIPYEHEEELDRLAKENGLSKTRVAHVAGKEGGVIKRSLIEYCKKSTGCIEKTSFYIRKNDGENKSFGPTYKELTKRLYIDF